MLSLQTQAAMARSVRGVNLGQAQQLTLNSLTPLLTPSTVLFFRRKTGESLYRKTRQQQFGEMCATRRVSLALFGHGAIKADTSTPPSHLVRHAKTEGVQRLNYCALISKYRGIILK